MAKNEKTSHRIAQLASKALRTGKATPAEIRKLAATALTQAPDKPKKRGK